MNPRLLFNTLKLLLFLLLYPLVVAASYISAVAVMVMFVAVQLGMQGMDVSFVNVFTALVGTYWYGLYGAMLAFLVLIYWYNRNRLEMGADMRFITPQTQPRVYNICEKCSAGLGIPMPLLLMQEHSSVNAYTAGISGDTYRIVLTSKLVQFCSDEEIEAVLAQQLVQLANGDTMLISISGMVTHIFSFLTSIMWPARWEGASSGGIGGWRLVLVGACKLANIGALFGWLFISHRREFVADAQAVQFTGNPRALVSVLKKVAENSWGVYGPAYINPLLFHYRDPEKFLATHPPLEARIAAIGLD